MSAHTMEMHENGRSLRSTREGFLAQLSPAARSEFDSLLCPSVYPEGATLFSEKEAARGVFVLVQGSVKLSICSSEGKTLILRIANAGEILAMNAALSAASHEVSAETMHTCQVAFVRRDDFLRFLARYPEAYLGVARELICDYRKACDQLRTVSLSVSVTARMATLLLNWSSNGQETKQGTRIKMPLTHEEIGEFIGTSRETVTRTLSDFKRRHLVALQGSTLLIPNRAALENLAVA